MIAVIKQFTVPPVFDDDAQTYAGKLLHWCVVVLTITELVAQISVLFIGYDLTLTLPSLILLGFITLYILHQGRLRLASAIFIGAMWAVVTLNAYTNRGIYSPVVGAYTLLIMLSAILLRERGAVLISIFSILSVILLAAVSNLANSTVPTPKAAPINSLVVAYIILFATAGTLVYVTGRSIRAAYKNLRYSEDQLAQRNRQLESQIAERQQAEAERDRLFELSIDMMAIAGVDGYFKRLNPAFERILGYTPEELMARPFVEFVHPEDAEATLREIENLRTGQHQPVFENRYRCKDGSYRSISWATSPVGDFLYAVARDVTEQKLVEIRQRELLLTKEKNQFLSEFLSTVSHDLKTPLSVINTNLYLIERLQDPIKQRDKINQIKEQTALVEKFIQDILTVTRLDHLPGLNMQPFDLNAMLTDIARQLRARAEMKVITVHLELDTNIPVVSGDSEQLLRAFANLLDNGLNYTPNEGKVDIRTFTDGNHVAVEITDTGIGIRDEDLPHIFDRFYRSPEARALEHGGTGLGLAIVKKVMDMHGYEILVTSRPGQGTTFRTDIPFPVQAAS
ncbi:MAG: PAS domain-containing sensor histidine kinase [Chloroflexota bacterium]